MKTLIKNDLRLRIKGNRLTQLCLENCRYKSSVCVLYMPVCLYVVCVVCRDLLPHCLEILKTAHHLTDKLVSVTLTNAHQLQFPETLTDLVAVARRIATRVDDVVRALYPPLDPRLLEARCFCVHLSLIHI